MVLCCFGGGMTSSGSFDSIRWMSELASGLPGTIAMSPLRSDFAETSSSNRSLALRPFSSGPWQAMQFSERMGRICRPKSIDSWA